MAGIDLNKTVDLEQLQAEMNTAGVNVTALGTGDGKLFTYDEDGNPADLPNGAAAVLTAHTPTSPGKDAIVALIQSTVGVAATDLTNNQRLALMLAMLYKAGAVNPRTLVVKPLNQWLT